jgi:hypothetical protein
MVTNQKDGTTKIVAPQDLARFTPLRLGAIRSKLHVPFAGSVDTLRLFLTEMFSGITESTVGATTPDADTGDGNEGAPTTTTTTTFGLHGDQVRRSLRVRLWRVCAGPLTILSYTLPPQVKVVLGPSKGAAIVEWLASPAGDMIADSVIALIMHAQSSSASIRLTSRPCRHPRDDEPLNELDEEAIKKQRSETGDLAQERLRFLYVTLKDQFDQVEASYEGNRGTFEIVTDAGLEGSELDEDGRLRCVVEVRLDGNSASGAEIKVESKDSTLAANVQSCLRNVAAAFTPLET